ncbi:unnamed protein product [Paramecium pentaurelia]|uniref:Transmembrane protein n=1 Tax=Paramecium pentaurelia TaxID=43138 RepID=A0A8S1U2R7_9CILI|nr:unnamed protein product [Paramecium pentaurelia]
MQFFSKLTQYFITIGSNTERRVMYIDYGNMTMIIYYFIQLIGYIYSQFESKSIKYYENDYLAQISQLSSIPFMLIIIHYDPLTIFAYYSVFITISAIFLISLLQILLKPLPFNSPINKFIKFYFQNFQWFFLTPFNECMVGVITCGRQSYLAQHSIIKPSECFSTISPHYLIISFTGMIMISFSGILSVYCFRNYEFLQRGLLRKFSSLNFVTIFLHQLLIILSFWKLMYSDYYIIIHACYNLIMLCILIDVVTNIPFGFTNETVFYSKILFSSLFFGILITIWIFTNKDDGIIFLTYSIFLPIIFAANSAVFSNYFEQQSLKFCEFINYPLSEQPLEYLLLLSHPLTMTQTSICQALKYLNIHCNNCEDLKCPCNQDLSKFVLSNGPFDNEKLYIWIQYQFQKLIKISMRKQYSMENFEQLTIKFSTFLQKYRENSYLSYKSIQDIVINFNRTQKNNKQYPQFFMSLTKKIQSDTKKELEQLNRSKFMVTKMEFKTLTDLNLFFFYENDLMINIKQQVYYCKEFWILYQNGTLKDFNALLLQSKKILNQIEKVQQIYRIFQQKREDSEYENILTFRINLLISISCLDDLNTQLKIADKLQAIQKESLFTSKQQFHILKYINSEAISVASLISFQSFGMIDLKISNNFISFFGYDHNDQITQIDQLLPIQIGQIHDGLVEKFLMVGQSSKIYNTQESFIKNKDNFIENITMCLTISLPLQADIHYFFILSHLLKQHTYEKKNQDIYEKGYLLVDVNFYVFGISENIFKKITQFSQNDIINLDQIQQKLTLFQLIPDLFSKMQEYYKIKQLQNSNLANYEVLFYKHGGSFHIPNKQFIDNYEQKTKNKNINNILTNKIINNNLIEIEKSFNFSNISQCQFSIEYSVVQNLLNPLINGIMSDFLYYKIEIEFQDDSNNSKSIFQILPSYQDIKKEQINSKNKSPNQSQVMLQSYESEDSNNQIHQKSQKASELKSENSLYNQVTMMNEILSCNKMPKPILNLILLFVLQLFIFIVMIIFLAILFNQKSKIQSNCVKINSIDLDFLDGYSQMMSGSRHVIYFRDFYQNLSDQKLMIDKNNIEFSLNNKLLISWNHINLGITRLINIYKIHSQTLNQGSEDDLNISIINSDLKSKIVQQVKDQSTYYQVMFQIFFMSKQTFTQNLSNFLQNSTDPYTTQISRSLVYYNYFDVSQLVQAKLESCKSYNYYINEYIDRITSYFFIALYLIISIIAIIQFIFYFQIKRQISFYLKLFIQIDGQDSNKCIQKFDNIHKILNNQSIVLSKKNYEKIIAQPSVQYDNLRTLNFNNQVNFIQPQKSKEKQIRIDNHISYFYHIFALVLISLIPIVYALAYQLYYNLISVNVTPINDQAIQAQQMRLKFITTINRYDQFLIKSYFESYCKLSQLNSSFKCSANNIYSDNQILQQIDMNETIIQEELTTFQQLDFSNFFFNSINSNQFNSEEKQSILSKDTCLLTNCDMKKDLFQERLFQENLNSYFFQGIIKLHQIVSSLYVQFDLIYKGLNTTEAKLLAIENIMQDNDYLIYILWGLDAIQYQIAQFSQYFVNTSLTILEDFTSNLLVNVLQSGIGMLLMIVTIQILFIQVQVKRQIIAKQLFKIVPLQIIFQKNIQRQLTIFQRKIYK